MRTRRSYVCSFILAVAAVWTPQHASAEAISSTNTSPSPDWHLRNTLVTNQAARPDKTIDLSFAPAVPLILESPYGRYKTEYISSGTDFTATYSLGKPDTFPRGISVAFGKIHGAPLPVIGLQPPAAVPEPGTVTLLGTGLALAIGIRARRRSSRSV